MTTGDVTYLVEELARLTDTVKRLGALAAQPVQPQSSVEIARNSKGVTWVVKAYHGTSHIRPETPAKRYVYSPVTASRGARAPSVCAELGRPWLRSTPTVPTRVPGPSEG
jgi:hypothetical protein